MLGYGVQDTGSLAEMPCYSVELVIVLCERCCLICVTYTHISAINCVGWCLQYTYPLPIGYSSFMHPGNPS